jgi:hypothetical protein
MSELSYDEIINECLEIMNKELYKKGFNIGKINATLPILKNKLIYSLNQIIQSGNLSEIEPIELRNSEGKRIYSFNLVGYLNQLKVESNENGTHLTH